MGDSPHTRAVLAQLGEVAVAYQSRSQRAVVFRTSQLIELLPDLFLEIGAEEHHVLPPGSFLQLPDFVKACRCCCYFTVTGLAVLRQLGSYGCKMPVVRGDCGNLSVYADDYPVAVVFHDASKLLPKLTNFLHVINITKC